MRLLASVTLVTLSLGCATVPVTEEQRALNTCLWANDQAGWHFLLTPPPNADTLRSAIVASGQRPLPEPTDHELWFSQPDGRYLRCTNALGGAFESDGMPSVCGAMTHILKPAGELWEVEGGDIVLCHRRR
jgi:hypothetical protein